MEREYISNLFKQSYNRSQWKQFLAQIFNAEFYSTPLSLQVNASLAQNAFHLGQITLEENGIQRNIAVYEVKVQADVIIERNRIQLRNLLKSYWRNIDGAFISYYSEESKKWRFSFVSELTGFDPDGNFYKTQTEPKRFTYVLGENENVRTATERFIYLMEKGLFITFNDVKQAFSVERVTQEFYQEIAKWYDWAVEVSRFPKDAEAQTNGRNVAVIRLLTRLFFIWFMKEKGIIPAHFFEEGYLTSILKNFNPTDTQNSAYYKAILQNLFFATLNTPTNERKFRRETTYQGKNADYMNHSYYRHHALFQNPDQMLTLFKDIPFLNGGLFECLDIPANDPDNHTGKEIRIDGFSDIPQKQPHVPNILFFDKYKGLLSIFKRYHFTIEENTPFDQQISLDPEMLGKIFENLLATYNPETQTTARKATGSFYTPREVVYFMVKQSLMRYFSVHSASHSVHSASHSVHSASLLNDESLSKDAQRTLGESLNKDVQRTLGESLSKDAQRTLGESLNKDVQRTLEDFFNPDNEIFIYNKHLPHWRQENVWYFVTFRLADSIPYEWAEKLRIERQEWLQKNKKTDNQYTPEQIREYYKLFSERTEQLLNNGYGSCVLKNPEIAKIVENALLHFNHQRYVLDEWVVMPNHVHILVKPFEGYNLSDILHSWKSYTANEINKKLGLKGQLWWHESYDHIVRNEKAMDAIRNYIIQNPIKAGITVHSASHSVHSASHSVHSASLLNDESLNKDVQLESLNKDVQRTLGESLSKDAQRTLEVLFSYSSTENPFNEQQTDALIQAIHNLKIFDPAVGSGAFPMEVLNTLVHILSKLDPHNLKWKNQQIQSIQNNVPDPAIKQQLIQHIENVFAHNELGYGRKLYLIQNCIYGADIQPVAIHIAKLRFFISLLVDEKLNPKLPNFGIEPLPNLETKLITTDTLTPLPKYENLQDNAVIDARQKLFALRKSYFETSDQKQKENIRKQDKELRTFIQQRLKNSGFPSEAADLIANTDIYNTQIAHEWFDPQWMFGVTNGFDIVIGNPPYIQLQKDGGRLAKRYEPQKDKKHKNTTFEYQTFARTGDIYVLFYERGMQLLKPEGHLCYITSNKWMRAGYGEKLRKFFTLFNPILLVDLGPGVFENATVDTNILLIQKAKPTTYALKALTLQKTDAETMEKQLQNYATTLTNLTQDAWFIGSSAEQQLKQKIERIGKPLKEWNINIYYGIKTGLNEAFIITTQKRNEILANCKDEEERKRTEAIIKPILRGRDIKRYTYEWANLWVIGTFPALRLKIDDYPALKKYFLDNFDIRQLEQSGEKYATFNARKKTGNKWFETQDQIAYYPEFEKEKVVYPNMATRLMAIWDNQKFLTNQKCFIITGLNTKFITALLNSEIEFWYFRKIGATLGKEGYEMSKIFMENLPIPPITSENEGIVQEIESLVERILVAKKENPQANTNTWEQEIDRLVYQLYELTEEEIRIIEGELFIR